MIERENDSTAICKLFQGIAGKVPREGMDYLDPQQSGVAWLILIGAIAGVCLLLWLLNKALRKLGVREHRADRMGSSILEVERLVRPTAEHVLTARKERKVTLPDGREEPPDGSE
ncbi:MAG TPA: hypothetical protein VKB58_13225 [Terriglobales bacterium]|nr:hypothetical protein [Terriglobales bacterium]